MTPTGRRVWTYPVLGDGDVGAILDFQYDMGIGWFTDAIVSIADIVAIVVPLHQWDVQLV